MDKKAKQPSKKNYTIFWAPAIPAVSLSVWCVVEGSMGFFDAFVMFYFAGFFSVAIVSALTSAKQKNDAKASQDSPDGTNPD